LTRLALDVLRSAVADHPSASTAFEHVEDDDLALLAERKLDSVVLLARGSRHPAQRLYELVWRAHEDALAEIAEAFEAAGVVGVVFKSADIVPRYLDDVPLGAIHDLDVLVGPGQLDGAASCLSELGFVRSDFDRGAGVLREVTVETATRYEDGHYELYALRRLVQLELDEAERAFVARQSLDAHVAHDGSGRAAVTVDLHHGLATNIEPTAVLGRVRPSNMPGMLAFSAADHLWFTLSRLYTETVLHGKRGLRDFVYAARLLQSGDVDWSVFLEANTEYELYAAVYYYLAFLDRIGAGPIPAEVLTEVSPLRSRRRRDWGWQLGRHFGFIEPYPIREPEDGAPATASGDARVVA
jgi:hypothetical protein